MNNDQEISKRRFKHMILPRTHTAISTHGNPSTAAVELKTEVTLKKNGKDVVYKSQSGGFFALREKGSALLTCVYDDQPPVNDEGDYPALQIFFHDLISGSGKDSNPGDGASAFAVLGWGQWFNEKHDFAFVFFDDLYYGKADIKFQPSADNMTAKDDVITVVATFELKTKASAPTLRIKATARGPLI